MSKRYYPYLWIIGLGALTYVWTIFFGFSYFDDNTLILGNLFFLRNLANIPVAFTMEVFHILHTSAAYYRPLLTVSFMLDSQLSGASPFFYHLTNVLIHIAASCLVFLFLQKLKIKRDISLLFAIIFVVHPVLAQAVAWIPGRNDSLLTVFALLSMVFFIDYYDSKKPKYLLWHTIFLAAAFFTKESALLIAPIIVLYLLLFGKWRFLIDKIHILFVWAAVLATWYILRSYSLQNPITYSLTQAIKSVYESLPIVVLDLGKMLFPVNLSVLPTLEDSTMIWGLITAVLIFVALLISRNKSYKLIFFGTVWFLVFLLPSFIRPSTEYVPDFLEHRIYLPIIGLFLVLSEIKIIKDFSFSGKSSKIIFGIIVTVLIVLNFVHTSVFKDKLVFWQSAVAASPHHPLAHKNLGAMYFLNGNLDKAMDEYFKALQLSPNEPMIHNNLGLIYAKKGDLKSAEEEYKKELEINPGYDNALYNYGILLYDEKRTDEAEKMWLDTLNVNPDYTDAMRALFVLYYNDKDTKKADFFYNELLQRGINPAAN